MKKAFLKIDNADLYIEKILVDYNSFPIFFVCRNIREELYIALCSDYRNEEYILSKTRPKDLLDMLYGRITIREYFTKYEVYWNVKIGETPQDDRVEKIGKYQIDSSVLPFEGEKYIIPSKDIKEYVLRLEAEIYDTSDWYTIDDIIINCNYGTEITDIEDVWIPLTQKMTYDTTYSGSIYPHYNIRINDTDFTSIYSMSTSFENNTSEDRNHMIDGLSIKAA